MTDWTLYLLTALSVIGFTASCVYHDAKSSRRASLIPPAGADMSGPAPRLVPARSAEESPWTAYPFDQWPGAERARSGSQS